MRGTYVEVAVAHGAEKVSVRTPFAIEFTPAELLQD